MGGVKKGGFGATKVKANFDEIEQAAMADKLRVEVTLRFFFVHYKSSFSPACPGLVRADQMDILPPELIPVSCVDRLMI